MLLIAKQLHKERNQTVESLLHAHVNEQPEKRGSRCLLCNSRHQRHLRHSKPVREAQLHNFSRFEHRVSTILLFVFYNYCINFIHDRHIGVSIVQWYSIGGNSTEASESSAEFAFYVAFSTSPKNGWSCPVRVDKGLIRRSITLTDYNSLSVSLLLIVYIYQSYLRWSVAQFTYKLSAYVLLLCNYTRACVK